MIAVKDLPEFTSFLRIINADQLRGKLKDLPEEQINIMIGTECCDPQIRLAAYDLQSLGSDGTCGTKNRNRFHIYTL